MGDTGSLIVRPLVIEDVDPYLRQVANVDAGSGMDGAAHSHAYSRSEPFDMEAGHDREVTRWTTDLDAGGWRRAWGLFDEHEIVGHVYLAGGLLESELHRANLGMGVSSSYRRRGGGSALLASAIAWAQNLPILDWVDLDVFSDNKGAQELYERHGFQILGRIPDCFRIDRVSLGTSLMTLGVGSQSSSPTSW